MKIHIPMGERPMCGTNSFVARATADDALCSRCLARMEKILIKHGYVVVAPVEPKTEPKTTDEEPHKIKLPFGW